MKFRRMIGTMGSISLLFLAACSGESDSSQNNAVPPAKVAAAPTAASSAMTEAPPVQPRRLGPEGSDPTRTPEELAIPGEMEREAEDMAQLCSTNSYQNKFFNCRCLGKEFLRFRKEEGRFVAAHEIYKRITNSRDVNPSCAETEKVAQEATQSCRAFVRGYSNAPADMRDNEEAYCACVGTKLSSDFTKTPRLSGSYVERLRKKALDMCRNPEFRDRMDRRS